MKTAQLIEIETLLSLKFRNRQQVYARIVAEESRLRLQLAKLDGQVREAEAESTQNLRAIGADVIWKRWVERAKTSLNLELAQVLAQKERLKASVRKEYGKVLVSQRLLEERREEDRRHAADRALDAAIEAHLLAASTGRRQE